MKIDKLLIYISLDGLSRIHIKIESVEIIDSQMGGFVDMVYLQIFRRVNKIYSSWEQNSQIHISQLLQKALPADSKGSSRA